MVDSWENSKAEVRVDLRVDLLVEMLESLKVGLWDSSREKRWAVARVVVWVVV